MNPWLYFALGLLAGVGLSAAFIAFLRWRRAQELQNNLMDWRARQSLRPFPEELTLADLDAAQVETSRPFPFPRSCPKCDVARHVWPMGCGDPSCPLRPMPLDTLIVRKQNEARTSLWAAHWDDPKP